MEFTIDRDSFLKSLSHANGIIEKKTTLPILSNILIEAKNSKIKITATDLDIIYFEEIIPLDVKKEGSTTTSASILYDILRKISSDSELNFDLKTENKLSLKSDNSDFNLLCLPTDNFPTFADEFEGQEILLNNSRFLKLLNKTKIAISNDDTRHYLNGIYLHSIKENQKEVLRAVATDGHRLSRLSAPLPKNADNLEGVIIPRKTVTEIKKIIDNQDGIVKIQMM